jgi:hypothetical protein
MPVAVRHNPGDDQGIGNQSSNVVAMRCCSIALAAWFQHPERHTASMRVRFGKLTVPATEIWAKLVKGLWH